MFLSPVCRELSPILEESADLRAVGNMGKRIKKAHVRLHFRGKQTNRLFLYVRVVTRYMGSRITSLKRAGIRGHSPGIWDHNARDRNQQYFLWNEGIRDQIFAGSGIKILIIFRIGVHFFG